MISTASYYVRRFLHFSVPTLLKCNLSHRCCTLEHNKAKIFLMDRWTSSNR